MFDFLKVVFVFILLVIAYYLLKGVVSSNISWSRVLNNRPPLQITDAELWSNPSPLRGAITISEKSTPKQENPDKEYIYIRAKKSNSTAIDMSGWSIKSIVSNTKVYFPPATLMLKMIGSNTTDPVYLAPGEYAILISGRSPIYSVTPSFHTNKCIGYISEFNNFTPTLSSTCVDTKTILPPTPENVKTYGAECIDFLRQAKSCKSYTNEMPANLLPACRDLVARKLNYHSCLSDGFNKEGYKIFNNGGWYLYLNHNAEIWRNTYEAIQLLDSQGRVVDVLKY